MEPRYRIVVDGREWKIYGDEERYDPIHAVAGAVLAGADTVTIERLREDE